MSLHGKSGTRESSLKLALAFCVADLMLMSVAAYRSNSVTIMGDLLKEATDTLAVLAAFYTIRAVRRSASQQFSYGIGKLENLVSIWIGVITLGCAIFVTLRAVHHMNNPQVPAGTEVGIAIFALYTGICFYIWARTKRAMGKHSSAIMESQAKLWFSKGCFDAINGSSLFIALMFSDKSWSVYVDPIASLLGVLFMLHAAWGMASSSVGDLLDATIEESIQLQIMRQLVHHMDSYERIHQVRARRSGPNIYVEIFLEFNPMDLMGDVQKRIDALRKDLQSNHAGMDISIRPTAAIAD
jgi:cation diffusion facilitator family transporter